MKLLKLSLKFIFIFIFPLSAKSQTKDLKYWFEIAKVANLNQKIQHLELEILKEEKKEILSTVLPQISARATFTELGKKSYYDNNGINNTNELIGLKATQAIFSGFREFYGLSSFNHRILAQEQLIKAKEMDLLAQISQYYFQAQLHASRSKNFSELLQLSEDREKLLKSRVKIGRSRQTELLSSQVQTANYKSQRDQEKLQERDAKSNILRICNISNDQLNSMILPSLEENLGEVREKTFYLANIDSHPLLMQKKELVQSLEEEKKANQATYSPVIDLEGNYLLKNSASSIPDPEWNLSLNLKLPLFEGGLTRAKVRESALKMEQAYLEKTDFKEELIQQINISHDRLMELNKQQKIYLEVVSINKKNTSEIKKEYSLGLVTSLEVMQALNTYIQSLNDLSENTISWNLALIKLKTMSGENL